MTLTLLLKSVWKKNSYFQQIDPFNLSVAGNADENMRIKYWGWKYRDEKSRGWKTWDEQSDNAIYIFFKYRLYGLDSKYWFCKDSTVIFPCMYAGCAMYRFQFS